MVQVVAALIWDNDRFLACQRPAHKKRGLLWEFVGGKVEPGESREEALRRECREELGIEINVRNIYFEFVLQIPKFLIISVKIPSAWQCCGKNCITQLIRSTENFTAL